MTNKTLTRHRNSAYDAQRGRCYYCKAHMWRGAPADFAHTYRITVEQARHFQCTAEHLRARRDGGADTSDNIVAACLACNRRRHSGYGGMAADRYRARVARLTALGLWHRQWALHRGIVPQAPAPA